MALGRFKLIGVGLLISAATGASAQTLNPITTLTLPQQSEISVSPALPSTAPGSLTSETTGTNPLTGLPCSGAGALSVSGAGGLSITTTAPPGSTSPTTPQLPTITSVFGSSTALGAC
jgi:hypothetical protein